MNDLVNHRLSKKQQMRWSPEGAHYLLQVRAELFNGTLIDGYRIANPGFRGPSGFSHASANPVRAPHTFYSHDLVIPHTHR
jgi:hypothetical protein